MKKDCPNNRVMIVNQLGQYESCSDKEDDPSFDSDPKHNNDFDGGEQIEFERGASLVCTRTLHAVASIDDDNQRENIFYTKCLIKGKVCNTIIDGGSCTNIASTSMVTKLQLQTFNHPKPYKLQWLNNCGALSVSKQVHVDFKIGNIKITCFVMLFL